jgi:Leucine-rich repeat (LRR) protein
LGFFVLARVLPARCSDDGAEMVLKSNLRDNPYCSDEAKSALVFKMKEKILAARNPQVTELDVSCFSFNELPDLIWSFVHLKELNARYNNLPTIANFIRNLEHLTVLNLSGNQITSFPLALCCLFKLENLNLGEQNFKNS